MFFLWRNKKKYQYFLGLKNAPYLELCFIYSKCPKISNTNVSDKMPYANNADPDQTAPAHAGAVWSASSPFAIPLSILRNKCMKNKI